ncbi:MAG TPA: hypothetical protein VHT97_03545 [Acidimicrobiales bacterium]|nr:hypothetical protein [Acidimicrobiales bacterium]
MQGYRAERPAVVAADEGRHPPGPGRAWEESWYLDFAAADGSLGGYVRLALRPGDRVAWFWAGVVGAGPRLVTVRDDEVPPPSGRALEVRASGLWTELVCETPMEHWSVGLEAFGVALDDPLEAWGQERGDPCALGLDVEWEALGPPSPWPGGGAVGYSQACAVSGDLLVGTRRVQLDCTGVRAHLWGDRDWGAPSSWAAGVLADGTAFSATGPSGDASLAVDADGLLVSGEIRTPASDGSDGSDGPDLSATALAHAPVLVPGRGRLARALCRYDAADGRRGFGWAERLGG